jgi:lactate permease
MWTQDYDPIGSWPLSTLLAALPILTLMGLLASNRVPAWLAASTALATAFGAAVLGFHMPWTMAASAAGVGAVFALIRVVYLIVAAMFLYDLAVKTGRFEVMKASIARLSPDRRIQAVLVAFSFGSFLEGCAGFGAPVAIASAFLVGLGFRPLQAAVVALAADTIPVSWGSVGIPLTTLGAVSGLDVPALSVTTARLLTIATVGLPFWLAAIVAGPRRAFGAWPPLLAVGATYAAVQLLWSRFVAVELVSIASAIASLLAGVVVLRFWRPRETFRFEGDDEPEPEAATDPDFGVPAAKLSGREVARAWMPFALLTVVVMIWVTPALPTLGTRSAKDVLDGIWSWKPEVEPLHKKVTRGAAVTGRETPTAADLEPAVLDLTPLSAVGTAVLVAAVVGGLLTGVGPGEQARIFLGTARRMKTAALAIVCMLALGFVTRYSGMDAVLGLAFTRTGPALYPVFGTLLGWLGTALTGSITSSNVLFGNLQRITATNLELSPILMGAANTAGGAMGKMIAAASIVVAAAATGEGGREGEVLRAALRHSLAMVAGVAAVVWVAARYAPWIAAVPAG